MLFLQVRLGECKVKIDKEKFVNLSGSLGNTYALPLRLLSTTADSILIDKDYTVIVIKYIDEHSGFYYTRGSQNEWDEVTEAIIPETSIVYSNADLSKNKIRSLVTQSLTQFQMQGMGTLGNANGTAIDTDRLLINLGADGAVTLETNTGSNAVTDKGSSYNANAKTFTLKYIYQAAGKSYLVDELLTLRQDVEKELRFQIWQ